MGFSHQRLNPRNQSLKGAEIEKNWIFNGFQPQRLKTQNTKAWIFNGFQPERVRTQKSDLKRSRIGEKIRSLMSFSHTD